MFLNWTLHPKVYKKLSLKLQCNCSIIIADDDGSLFKIAYSFTVTSIFGFGELIQRKPTNWGEIGNYVQARSSIKQAATVLQTMKPIAQQQLTKSYL